MLLNNSVNALADQMNKYDCEIDVRAEWMTDKSEWMNDICFNCNKLFFKKNLGYKLYYWWVCLLFYFTECNHDFALINAHQVNACIVT